MRFMAEPRCFQEDVCELRGGTRNEASYKNTPFPGLQESTGAAAGFGKCVEAPRENPQGYQAGITQPFHPLGDLCQEEGGEHGVRLDEEVPEVYHGHATALAAAPGTPRWDRWHRGWGRDVLEKPREKAPSREGGSEGGAGMLSRAALLKDTAESTG